MRAICKKVIFQWGAVCLSSPPPNFTPNAINLFRGKKFPIWPRVTHSQKIEKRLNKKEGKFFCLSGSFLIGYYKLIAPAISGGKSSD